MSSNSWIECMCVVPSCWSEWRNCSQGHQLGLPVGGQFRKRFDSGHLNNKRSTRKDCVTSGGLVQYKDRNRICDIEERGGGGVQV